jgi:hypothetical protein
MRIRDARWSAVLLATMYSIAASALTAQECRPPLRKLPVVNLTVSVKGCDYLSALAEPAHIGATSNCTQLASAVTADPSSRVHTLLRMVVDSLRPVLAHHFGFLTWPKTADSSAWSATVVLNQPHRGADGTLQIVLHSAGGVDTASEAIEFERFGAIAQLFREPKTPQSLAALSGRWASAARTLLTNNNGFNRTKLVKSVFRAIPIAALSTTEATPLVQGQSVEALLPVRDADIRVKKPDRPTFEWQVEKVERGQPPDEDEGVFVLGECSGSHRYRCKMLRLRYGAAMFEGTNVAQFFDATTRLHAPISLHIVDYRPGPTACPMQGEMPE